MQVTLSFKTRLERLVLTGESLLC